MLFIYFLNIILLYYYCMFVYHYYIVNKHFHKEWHDQSECLLGIETACTARTSIIDFGDGKSLESV